MQDCNVCLETKHELYFTFSLFFLYTKVSFTLYSYSVYVSYDSSVSKMACWLAAGQLKLVSWHEQQFFISCPPHVTDVGCPQWV